jgi:hypothetical protein
MAERSGQPTADYHIALVEQFVPALTSDWQTPNLPIHDKEEGALDWRNIWEMRKAGSIDPKHATHYYATHLDRYEEIAELCL